jgi:hypothetical protein
MDINNYLSRMPAFLAWMYSGAIRIADYLADSGELDLPEEIRLGIDYLRLGVSSPAARFLAETVGIPRSVATFLSEQLSYDSADLEATLLEGVVKEGRQLIREATVDEWQRREALRALRDLDPQSAEA